MFFLFFFLLEKEKKKGEGVCNYSPLSHFFEKEKNIKLTYRTMPIGFVSGFIHAREKRARRQLAPISSLHFTPVSSSSSSSSSPGARSST